MKFVQIVVIASKASVRILQQGINPSTQSASRDLTDIYYTPKEERNVADIKDVQP